MSDHIIFMMGNFEARFPTDRKYCRNHMWFKTEGRKHRFGFSGYAVRLLQDVFFLDWTIDPHTVVRGRQEIGEIESSKAVSTLFAPADGEVLEFNESLLDDPSVINTDNYGDGWLYRFRTATELLSPSEYLEILQRGWEDTQRMLKGQIN